MIQKIRLLIISTFSLLTLGLVPVAVLAAPDCANPASLSTAEAIQCGTDNAAGVPQGANPGNSINKTINNAIDIISVAVGAAAVIMLMVGGFRYITSAGNQESVKGAKNTIIYALVGLVIVALAQIIVQFVLTKTDQSVSGTTSTTSSPPPHTGGF